MRTTLAVGVLALAAGGADAQVIGFPAGIPGPGTPYSSPGWGIYAPGYSHGIATDFGNFRPTAPPAYGPRPGIAPTSGNTVRPAPLFGRRRAR